MENYGRLSFAEFERLKAEKHLTLDNIDSFHIQLKRHINKKIIPQKIKLYVLIIFIDNKEKM